MYIFKVVLNSLHKYKPKLSIIDVMLKKKIYETSFDETEFIAVTAYQNDDVKNFFFFIFFYLNLRKNFNVSGNSIKNQIQSIC